MTELMKQLQRWATEGRYDWEKETFNWEGVDNAVKITHWMPLPQPPQKGN
jgi:hypothetical protein